MKEKLNKKIIHALLFILGIIIISLTFNIFCVPNNYVTGGISGVAIIFKHIFKICL